MLPPVRLQAGFGQASTSPWRALSASAPKTAPVFSSTCDSRFESSDGAIPLRDATYDSVSSPSRSPLAHLNLKSGGCALCDFPLFDMAFPLPFSPTLEMIGAFLSRGHGVSRNREPYYSSRRPLGPVEVRLGPRKVDEAARHLKELADRVDQEHEGSPSFLAVVTGIQAAYRREDGAYVIPLATMAP